MNLSTRTPLVKYLQVVYKQVMNCNNITTAVIIEYSFINNMNMKTCEIFYL